MTVSELRCISGDGGDVGEPAAAFDVSIVCQEAQLSKGELNIICYVAGYVGLSFLRRSPCDGCRVLLLDSGVLAMADLEVSDNTEFITLMTRGGLKSPSDLLFIICCWTYMVFCELRSSPRWMDFIRLPHPANTFVSLSRDAFSSSVHSHLLDSVCAHGHTISAAFSRIALSFFNVLAKNYVRRTYKSCCSANSKIRKLNSE